MTKDSTRPNQSASPLDALLHLMTEAGNAVETDEPPLVNHSPLETRDTKTGTTGDPPESQERQLEPMESSDETVLTLWMPEILWAGPAGKALAVAKPKDCDMTIGLYEGLLQTKLEQQIEQEESVAAAAELAQDMLGNAAWIENSDVDDLAASIVHHPAVQDMISRIDWLNPENVADEDDTLESLDEQNFVETLESLTPTTAD